METNGLRDNLYVDALLQSPLAPFSTIFRCRGPGLSTRVEIRIVFSPNDWSKLADHSESTWFRRKNELKLQCNTMLKNAMKLHPEHRRVAVQPKERSTFQIFQWILPVFHLVFWQLADSSRFFQYFTKSFPCRCSELVYSELHILPWTTATSIPSTSILGFHEMFMKCWNVEMLKCWWKLDQFGKKNKT